MMVGNMNAVDIMVEGEEETVDLTRALNSVIPLLPRRKWRLGNPSPIYVQLLKTINQWYCVEEGTWWVSMTAGTMRKSTMMRHG